tara:strand:+ start:9570 stop:10118 length:549 start_codon:yes stop_codon:yes gene_type:complete
LIIEKQELEDVLLLKPKIYNDHRGYFFESFKYSIFEDIGLNLEFVQDNEVYSSYAGIIRGLHYQLGKPQGKLVHVVKGSIKDVIVDIRIGSSDFGKSMMVFLDSQSHDMIYIPEGFAHGYLVLESNTIVQYKCTEYYDATSEYGILWNDKDLNINWDISNPILSEKDKSHPKLKDQKNLPKI